MGTRVFISWSGEISKLVATALRDWLPDMLHAADPFMSDADIRVGTRWFEALDVELRSSHFVVICATSQNARSEWIHFEAGAIAMARTPTGESARVAPYLIDLRPTDLKLPLSLYEGQRADEIGTKRLVEAVYSAAETPISQIRLDRAFKIWWPFLDEALDEARSAAQLTQTPTEPVLPQMGESPDGLVEGSRNGADTVRLRTLEDKVDELLTLMRHTEREMSSSVTSKATAQAEWEASIRATHAAQRDLLLADLVEIHPTGWLAGRGPTPGGVAIENEEIALDRRVRDQVRTLAGNRGFDRVTFSLTEE